MATSGEQREPAAAPQAARLRSRPVDGAAEAHHFIDARQCASRVVTHAGLRLRRPRSHRFAVQ